MKVSARDFFDEYHRIEQSLKWLRGKFGDRKTETKATGDLRYCTNVLGNTIAVYSNHYLNQLKKIKYEIRLPYFTQDKRVNNDSPIVVPNDIYRYISNIEKFINKEMEKILSFNLDFDNPLTTTQ
jgi:hypothetical protein